MIGINVRSVVIIFVIALLVLAVDLVTVPYFQLRGVGYIAALVLGTVVTVFGAVLLAMLCARIGEIVRKRRFSINNSENLKLHISRLLASPDDSRSLLIQCVKSERGFSLLKLDSTVQALFTVDSQDSSGREAALRSFFRELGTDPTNNSVGGNGTDSGRFLCLSYSLRGDAAELTALTKRILVELCGISPQETIRVSYL